MPLYKLFVIVPRANVKAAKVFLEEQALFDRKRKITPLSKARNREEHLVKPYIIEPRFIVRGDSYFLIPTTKTVDVAPSDLLDTLSSKDDHFFGTVFSPSSYFLAAQAISLDATAVPITVKKEPLVAAVQSWLNFLPKHICDPLTSKAPGPYTVYPPLLLLSANVFPLPWSEISSSNLAPYLPVLFQFLRERFKVTHIAINAPIPPRVYPSKDLDHENADPSSANYLRSPSNLILLDGDFGPPFPSDPTDENLGKALWVSTIQYNITQVWAPLHTMFSRGNVREKARVLSFCKATIPDPTERATSTAVDLYAGIGYFSFCYAKSGMGLVLGWELNPWSVEGGIRGAKANGWEATVIAEDEEWGARGWKEDGSEERVKGRKRIVFFYEDNKKALWRILRLKKRRKIPPVRHVNLGLLPTSRASWQNAVKVLDEQKGGWIHAHMNCPVGEVEERRDEVERTFQGLVDERQRTMGFSEQRQSVRCEHVERVKTYAPGIMHCVFDISITPLKCFDLPYR